MQTIDHAQAILDLLPVLDGELDNLNWLYSAIEQTPKDTVMWIDLTMGFIPAAHEAYNETRAALLRHIAQLGGQ